MTCTQPAPVGQQGPPARSAAFDPVVVTPRHARVPPIDYGDSLGRTWHSKATLNL